jgi:hypothetical protein
MSTPGLAYEQAPPFGVPLGFFRLAPGFLLLAAVAGLATAPQWLESRWSSASLAITHLITLGYLGMVMLGALLQMVPVLLGIPVPAVRLVSLAGVAGLSTGTVLLGLGLWLGESRLLHMAMLFLFLGMLPFLVAMAYVLARARSLPWVAWPMRQAWLGLVFTLAIGFALAGGLSGLWPLSDPLRLTALHLAWGLGGWVMVLIIGVAYQVVPMLQLTPNYPSWVRTWLTWPILLSLLAYAMPFALANEQGMFLLVPALLSVLFFAGLTLGLFRRRRRKISDATLHFWYMGMVSLIISVLALPMLHWLPDGATVSLGIAFLLGSAASVVNGMLYKIVPFLAWFHLQAQTRAKAGTIPNMKDMISDASARLHLRMHVAAVAALVLAPLLPQHLLQMGLATAGTVLLGASAAMLWRNLGAATRLFLQHGGRL